MIHDTIDQLTFYASAIPHLQQVALLDTASTSIEGLQVLFAQYTTAPFGGTFMVHPSKVCVVLTLQGSELLVTTYRRKDREGPKDENGFISIPDSPGYRCYSFGRRNFYCFYAWRAILLWSPG
nr:hypothetical protein [uncultured Sphaerochaeta sp.]